jgi:hypothetical protein
MNTTSTPTIEQTRERTARMPRTVETERMPARKTAQRQLRLEPLEKRVAPMFQTFPPSNDPQLA